MPQCCPCVRDECRGDRAKCVGKGRQRDRERRLQGLRVDPAQIRILEEEYWGAIPEAVRSLLLSKRVCELIRDYDLILYEVGGGW